MAGRGGSMREIEWKRYGVHRVALARPCPNITPYTVLLTNDVPQVAFSRPGTMQIIPHPIQSDKLSWRKF